MVVVVVVVAAAAHGALHDGVDAAVDVESKNDRTVDFPRARRVARVGIALVFLLYRLLFEASYLEAYKTLFCCLYIYFSVESEARFCPSIIVGHARGTSSIIINFR